MINVIFVCNTVRSTGSYNLRLVANHLLFLARELLFELLFSQLNQGVLESVFRHKCTIELEALMAGLDLFERINLGLEAFHFTLNPTNISHDLHLLLLGLLASVGFLEVLLNILPVFGAGRLQDA